MNAGQEQFYDFILARTKTEQRDDMIKLLKEGFSRQDAGTFTKDYLKEYTPQMLRMLRAEFAEEVRHITEGFEAFAS